MSAMLLDSESTHPTPTVEPEPPVEQAGHVPWVQKLAWGASAMGETYMVNAVPQIAMPIYNIALGVSPEWIGWALAIPRICDAFVDPFLGNLSDNTRSRWGRRRPFIAIGAIMASILFALIWMPPTRLTHNGLFLYFLITSILYFLGYAIYAIPNSALGFELTTDYNERTSLSAWRSFFGSAGGLLLPWAYKLSLKLGEIFPDGSANKPEVIGIRYVGIMIALLILGCCILPALFCREKNEVQAQPKIKIVSAFLLTLANYPFLLLTGIVFTILVGLNLVGALSTYINIYYVCSGSKDLAAKINGVNGTAYCLVGLAAIPLVTWLSTRWGKRATLLAAQFLVTVGSLSSLVLFTPKHPYWQIIPPLAMCPGLTCVWILAGSMIMDVCDFDELKSGLRREGMFGAVYQLVFKAGVAVATVLGGYMLTWSGYNSELNVQSPHTIALMRYSFACLPAAALVLSIVLTWLYPITEKKAREVRAILDARKSDKDGVASQPVA